MNNDVLKEAVKELISKEEIEAVVRETTYEYIRDNRQYAFEKMIMQVAEKAIDEKGKSILDDILEGVMNGPVRIDNGWGDIKEKGSFEDFVRSSIRDKCYSEWNVERRLRDIVDGRLKKIVHDVVGRHLEDDLTGEVMEELAKELGEGK